MNTIFLVYGPIGTVEMITIAMLVLFLFGAKKLPIFSRSLSKSMAEYRKARKDFESDLFR